MSKERHVGKRTDISPLLLSLSDVKDTKEIKHLGEYIILRTLFRIRGHLRVIQNGL